MIVRKFILILVVSLCIHVSVPAQEVSSEQLSPVPPSAVLHVEDFNNVVLPITELKFVGIGITSKFGTGFCVDPECRFIGTNYHFAAKARPKKIRGQRVLQTNLATGPDDEGATWSVGPYVSPMKYNLCRDLAVFELRHPLSRFHGIAFSLHDLQVGEDVDIYTFPKETLSPVRRLWQFHGRFSGQTTRGLLAFEYELSQGKAIRPGASGGIVVESKTQQIVGVLNGIERNGEQIALAVPVQALADLVHEAQPWLAQRIFPYTERISPISVDVYPKFIPPPPDGLQHRPEEPAEVKELRSKAQLLADNLRNFMAVQTLAWGSRDNVPVAVSAYEIQVLGGYQRFREYPDGNKELKNIPFPPLNTAMVPGGEWSELPGMVGTELHLNIHQADDTVVNGQRIRVFQYWADPEDDVCRWKSVLDFGFFPINKIVTVACYGEVWTDEDSNILRISEHYELPGRWKDFHGVVTYGWLQRKNEIPLLVPLTIATQAEYKKKVYWCRGHFTDYQKFTSQTKMVAK
jgi:hypothetical protein